DKIIRKSIEQNKPFKEIADEYAGYFLEDSKKLKIKEADVFPRATEHMDNIINLIKELEEKSFAYNVNGNVFYDVSKFEGYGKLSGKNIEDLVSGARIEINKEKKNPLDFSLWKKAKEGEPYWESPWGNGRPGWHVECSAMSCKHLGNNFDIHAGGSDLIFPHHENEIAQSEAANGEHFVNYWLHFGFLNINNQKMSKSLGNFFTARDILKKYSAEAIRLFFVQAHYSGPLNFNEELLAASQKGLEKLTNLQKKIEDEFTSETMDGITPKLDFNQYKTDFQTAMNDDFNTPQATAVIFDFVKNANKIIGENTNINSEFYSKVKTFLQSTAESVLGIMDFTQKEEEDMATKEKELIELLIKLRQDAKAEKNYSLADKIRDELNAIGVVLEDSKDKTTYKITVN
ncbi:MAG: cysteine--tRNA ligase, partial [Bacteroidetes bacterium]|nr:cysteine--tRNA ligase [Bacteroidota bacterium]